MNELNKICPRCKIEIKSYTHPIQNCVKCGTPLIMVKEYNRRIDELLAKHEKENDGSNLH